MDLRHDSAADGAMTAVFEFPGLKREDINIDINNDILTISAESNTSSHHEQDGYAIRERHFGRFSRSLQVPRGAKVRRH